MLILGPDLFIAVGRKGGGGNRRICSPLRFCSVLMIPPIVHLLNSVGGHSCWRRLISHPSPPKTPCDSLQDPPLPPLSTPFLLPPPPPPPPIQAMNNNCSLLSTFSGARTWSTVRPRGDISPPVRSCFSVGVVSSSAFFSIRPSTAHSAPPCTPMPSGFLGDERLNSRPSTTRPESWCESVARWDRSSASLGSLDSTVPFHSSGLSVSDNKRSQARPASMFSSEVYENSRGMTLSDDSLHPHPNQTTAQNDRPVKAHTLPAHSVTSVKKSRVYSQELLNVNSPVSADVRRNLSHPFACLLVLGGKTRTQADLGKSIDIWRCDIDPGMDFFG